MPTKPDTKRMRAWQSLLIAHSALVSQLDHELQATLGIPLQWYEVLLRLYRAPGNRMRMQELTQSMFFTPSGVTRLVDRLVQAGLVKREQCPTDKRGFFATLTPKGVEAFREAGPLHLKGIQQHFGRHVSEEEADAMADAFTRVVDGIYPAGSPRELAV
jgi:DNA-binding MarR family transcriptional regulator